MRTPLAYIAGPMKKQPEGGRAAFESAQVELFLRGYDVVTPVEGCDRIEEATPLDHQLALRKWAKVICDCDLVVALAGWDRSRGARFEVNLALELGIPVEFYRSLA